MMFRAFCLSILAGSALISGAHAAANATLPIIIGPLPPVHIYPPPLPWPPIPVHPRPPFPIPEPIIPGRGCVPTPGTACPL